MKDKIEEIYVRDLPDTKTEPDGYDLKTVPDISAKNIAVIIDKINEIIKVVNSLVKK